MYEGTPPEWGIIGFVVISAMGLLAYWVRAARADLTSTQKRFMDAVERASERDAARSDRQTEAIVASTNATQRVGEALQALAQMVSRHDERATRRATDQEEAAEARHHAVIDRIESIRRDRAGTR